MTRQGGWDPARLQMPEVVYPHTRFLVTLPVGGPVAALPKNNYGKVLKTELRRILAEPSNGSEKDELRPGS
jgi:hypothetical protein